MGQFRPGKERNVHESVKIVKIQQVTHNVRSYTLERPAGYAFEPGQATELSLDEDGWRDKKHPFTFTALSDEPNLEFTIKSYFDTGGDGMTERLYGYEPGQRLILRDAWGTITYKGPGTFIAGGAGVTPFIAILRQLGREGKAARHRLIASNRAEKDIILRDEFEGMAGLDTVWTVTDDPAAKDVRHDRINAAFLRETITDFSQHFYLCGPDPMVKDLRETLAGLGADVEAMTWEK
jgi:ferredoxin-NADP reductase